MIETLKPHDRHVDSADLPAAIGRAVRASNDAIGRRVEADAQLTGMGSTMVGLLWSGNTAVLANVGDSRAYLLRRDEPDRAGMRQVTEDHVYGHLVADATDVPNLPERLTHWLDGRPDGRSPDVTNWDLRPGDRFLLCSDGLSSFVPHGLIDKALRSSDGPQETADRLVALTLDHEAPDNVSVIVLDAHGGD